MFNKIIIVGNLTRDVELRHLPSSSTAVATLGIASNRPYTKQDGTKADETCFVDVKLFGRTAEVASQYLRKGSKVLIEGRLVYETWSDQNGQKRSKHSIVAETMKMLDSKNASGGYGGDSYDEGYGRESGYGNSYGGDSYGSNAYGGSQSGGNSSNYGGGSHSPNSNKNYQNPQSKPQQDNIPSIDIDDDDIPF